MISRHSALIGLFLDACIATLTLAVPVTASADDFKPFDIPEEAGPFGSEGADAPLPEFLEPGPVAPADAGADSGTAPKAAPLPTPVDTGPPILAPSIDAYVDLSFNDSRADDFGYQDTPGGYRFIAGFLVDNWSEGRVSMAPEVGYVRLGLAEASSTTTTLNLPIPQYINIKTVNRSLDLSTLTFGVRGSYRFQKRLEAFGRAGLHLYHAAQQEQEVLTYTPAAPNTPPWPDDIKPTISTSNVGTDYYLSGGFAVKLGAVPSLYAEYGVYAMGKESVTTTSVGFLLNF